MGLSTVAFLKVFFFRFVSFFVFILDFVSNGLYPGQNIRSVGTELGPNYLQMLSADKERLRNLRNNEYKSG